MSEIQEPIRLTQYSHGAGCGCKIAPKDLELILQHAPSNAQDALLVGNASRDDAAVYDLGEGRGLIATTDFFTPIVDDAFTFGKIAACNAISDVYAMGGDPMLALAILGWPMGKLPLELAGEIMKGAQEVCQEAGIPLAGGHSIDIPEPVFGLSVNGSIALTHLKTNAGAQANDLIYLTKPLGVGILSTAEKRGILQEDHKGIAAGLMTQLNRVGKIMGTLPGVHAMTDVTGFGLLGHLHEMCRAADTGAEIRYSDIPLLDAAKVYAAQFVFADNTTRNWNAVQELVTGITGESMITLCDPQTNGGLLLAIDPAVKEEVETIITEHCGKEFAHPIGVFTKEHSQEIHIEA